MKLHILSRTSSDVLGMLENLEVDAGVTYLDHEKLPRVVPVPLYRESYCFVAPTAAHSRGGASAAWAELAGVKLALLTPDMQNRRIIERALREAGVMPLVAVEIGFDDRAARASARRQLGEHPAGALAEGADVPAGLRAIPLTAPDVSATVGLVVPHREPLPVLSAALVAEARRMAPP